MNEKFITEYRDKFLIEKNRILNEYANKTSSKGQMYYVYSKNSQNEDTYNLCICEEGRNHEIIEVNKENLPEEAEVESVLRIESEKYIVDDEATKEIATQIESLINELLEEQTKYLGQCKVEGHIYEVGEVEKDRVWLYDITTNDGDGIEEIDFPKELLEQISEGDEVKFENGEYIKRVCSK